MMFSCPEPFHNLNEINHNGPGMVPRSDDQTIRRSDDVLNRRYWHFGRLSPVQAGSPTSNF
jgi:hypothetical protein